MLSTHTKYEKDTRVVIQQQQYEERKKKEEEEEDRTPLGSLTYTHAGYAYPRPFRAKRSLAYVRTENLIRSKQTRTKK